MCAHSHGSTGISGVVYIDGGVWGPEWDDHTFLGNPVTSKVNHDHVTFSGTTPKANEEPDFMTSTDPWFRPVDLHLGPDSALYVVDFYNRIIGHYEVPLDHPGRDRERGRIWRVVKDGHTGKLTDCNLAAKKAGELMQELASPNITRRYLATEELVSRATPEVLELARQQISDQIQPDGKLVAGDYLPFPEPGEVGSAHVHAMWVAFRMGSDVLPFQIARGLMGGGTRLEGNTERLSAACLRAIAEKGSLLPEVDSEGDLTVMDAQFDARGPFSMREAGLALVRHARAIEDVQGFLRPRALDSGKNEVLDPGDPALLLVWRMASRAWLSQPEAFHKMDQVDFLNERLKDEFAFIACSIPTGEAAEWLLKYVKQKASTTPELPVKITHLAKHLPAARETELIALVQEHFATDIDGQLDLYQAIREGQKKRGAKSGDAMHSWSAQLTQKLLASLKQDTPTAWRLVQPPTDTSPNPWHAKMVKCSDGRQHLLLDSHPPGGEKLTGTLRSGVFELPDQFSFWMAGHNGLPTVPSHGKNFVRLVDASSGQELAKAEPPRNDVAQKVIWRFAAKSEDAGKDGTLPRGSGKVYLELSDGDTAGSFAWLAVGEFEPALPILTLPENSEPRDSRIRALAQLSHEQGAASDALAFLGKLDAKERYSAATRSALAECLVSTLPDMPYTQVASLASDAELAATVFAVLNTPKQAAEELSKAFRLLPFRGQVKLATALAGTPASAEQLLTLAPARVLADPLVGGKVKALNAPAITKRLSEVTANLPPTNEAAKTIIAARLKSFPTAKPDEKRGQQVFQINCAICHRIGVAGNLVGPQLDGIGARGAERLLEDLLDPNRAVDPAFRLHFVKQKNGNLMTGLFRREQDGVQYFADAAGQEHAISKVEITEDQISEFSLMPAGFGELISEKDLHDLLAYLLARK
jgi:putative heme-binding domain-containing protein